MRHALAAAFWLSGSLCPFLPSGCCISKLPFSSWSVALGFAALGISVTQRLPLASCTDLRPTALSITEKCTALLLSLFTAPSQYLSSGFLLTDNVCYNISHHFSPLCVKLHIQELWKENQQVPGALSLWERASHHLKKEHKAIAPGEKIYEFLFTF